ncbi:Unknown protein, partial [Striga hermonthica]
YSTLSAKIIRESTRLESEFWVMVDRCASLKEVGLTPVYDGTQPLDTIIIYYFRKNINIHRNILQVPLEDFGGDGEDYRACFVTDELFDNPDKAIEWEKNIAIIWGFHLVISRHNKDGTVRTLGYDRGERYRGKTGKLENLVNAVLRRSKTKYTGCLFQLNVKFEEVSQNWCIWLPLEDEKGFHNHALTVYPEGHRQISRLSDSSKEIIRDMSDAQARPAAILAAIQEKNPVDNATCQQVYNYKARLRKDHKGGRDIAGQLLHLAIDNNYVVYPDVDPNTQALTRVFMSHPRAASLLRTYYWYVGIDSTYKTNRY